MGALGVPVSRLFLLLVGRYATQKKSIRKHLIRQKGGHAERACRNSSRVFESVKRRVHSKIWGNGVEKMGIALEGKANTYPLNAIMSG